MHPIWRGVYAVGRREVRPSSTSPATSPRTQLEDTINAADKFDLVDPETLRAGLDAMPRTPGVAPLRRLLDRHTFTLTDSELERRFLALVRRARCPAPLTQHWVDGFRVDFYWPDLGLVVETDGLRYHRTPAQQARDRLRDQAHTAAGLTPLRFTRAQVRFDPAYVQATLEAVSSLCRTARLKPRRGVEQSGSSPGS